MSSEPLPASSLASSASSRPSPSCAPRSRSWSRRSRSSPSPLIAPRCARRSCCIPVRSPSQRQKSMRARLRLVALGTPGSRPSSSTPSCAMTSTSSCSGAPRHLAGRDGRGWSSSQVPCRAVTQRGHSRSCAELLPITILTSSRGCTARLFSPSSDGPTTRPGRLGCSAPISVMVPLSSAGSSAPSPRSHRPLGQPCSGCRPLPDGSMPLAR
ncbi:unannotated protein [freshwater metagenome]|uniref:Unannotated protein n=1 Tax=freshwater metagenome TaxID=449393 RepID=A0A6J6T8N2_9ZZZZ